MALELAGDVDVVVGRPPLRGLADGEILSHPVGLRPPTAAPHRPVRRFVDLHGDHWYSGEDSDPLGPVEGCCAGHDDPAAGWPKGGGRTTTSEQLKDEPGPASRRYWSGPPGRYSL